MEISRKWNDNNKFDAISTTIDMNGLSWEKDYQWTDPLFFPTKNYKKNNKINGFKD